MRVLEACAHKHRRLFWLKHGANIGTRGFWMNSPFKVVYKEGVAGRFLHPVKHVEQLILHSKRSSVFMSFGGIFVQG